MFASLTNEEIEKVLSKNFIGRIGCYADNKTYVVPISYAYDNGCIYARTFEGMKISMMRKNPNVCFQVDEMENTANWKSVIIWGAFEELSEPKERNNALKKLISRTLPKISSETVKLSPQWPFPTTNYEEIEGIVFRICIKEQSGRCEKMKYERK